MTEKTKDVEDSVKESRKQVYEPIKVKVAKCNVLDSIASTSGYDVVDRPGVFN